MASHVPFKLKYHDDFGKSIRIDSDLYKARLIQEATMKKFIVIAIMPENSDGEGNIDDLGTIEEENSLEESNMTKAKILRLVLDGDFKVVQLDSTYEVCKSLNRYIYHIKVRITKMCESQHLSLRDPLTKFQVQILVWRAIS